jgi:hypothetical protein
LQSSWQLLGFEDLPARLIERLIMINCLQFRTDLKDPPQLLIVSQEAEGDQNMHRKNITGEKYFLLIADYEISQCGRFANAVNCRTS